MDALILTMFVSLVLACGGVAMFVWLAGARTFDHADRLALLPMEDDSAPEVPSSSASLRAADVPCVRPIGRDDEKDPNAS